MAKSKIITGLDIGSNSIRALVVRKKPKGEDLEVLGQEEETSAGIRRGVVIDVSRVAEIISSVLKKAEDSAGQKIDSVYTNVGGAHLYCTSSRGLVSVSRADQKISEEDIARVLEAAQTFSLPSNKEILEVFPKEFIIDGEKGIREPLGLQGVRLEAEVLALCGFSPYFKNLTQAVLNSGFQINDLVVSPLASARAVLTPREKELGVALLDIGAGTTGLCVFEEGTLIHLAIFPIGAGHITNDIATCLKTDIDTAERTKIEFGSCLLTKSDKGDKKIRIAGEEPLVFSKKMLVKIIEARISEIFGEVQKELKKISRQGLLPAGIVLTGGGAKLPKIRDLSKNELKLPCRISFPQGFSPLQEDSSLAAVCGLVLEGADLETERKISFSEKGIGAKLKKIFKIFIP